MTTTAFGNYTGPSNLANNISYANLFQALANGKVGIGTYQAPMTQTGQFGTQQPLYVNPNAGQTGQFGIPQPAFATANQIGMGLSQFGNQSAPLVQGMQPVTGFIDANGKPISSLGGMTLVPGANGTYSISIPDPSGGALHVNVTVDPKTGMITTPSSALAAPGGTTYTGGQSGGVLNGFVNALIPEIKAIAPVALAGLGGAALAGAFAPAAAGAAAADTAAGSGLASLGPSVNSAAAAFGTGGGSIASDAALAAGAGASGTAATGAGLLADTGVNAGLSAVPPVSPADIASASPGSIATTGGSAAGNSAMGSMANLSPVAGGGLDTAAAAGPNGISQGLTAAEQAMINSAPADLANSGAYAPGGTGFDNIVQGTTGLTGSANGNAAGTSISDVLNGLKTANSAYNAVNQALSPQQYGASGGPGLYAQPAQASTIRNGSHQAINTEPQYAAYNIVPQAQANTGNLLSGLEYGLSTKPYGYRRGGEVDGVDDSNPLFITGKTGFHVQGPGDGQSDSIPARLADGEYVIDADTVAALGNGSNRAGAKALDKMREAIRKHKRAAPINKIPPPAKHPLAYLRSR